MAFFRSRGSRILLALAGLVAVAGGGALLAFYWTFLQDLPDLRRVEDYRPPVASRVLDRSGVVVGSFFEERRTLTPLDRIPEHVVQAFIASEDNSFFEHSGIDYRSILRAAWVNLRAGGEIKQGASTITQQMVKGLLLTPERKFKRKIREMILARQIEQRFSKEEILYLYLNQIYFGHGAYGIGEAALSYFGKPIEEVGISEGAMLAGLPKAPTRYSPFRNPEESERRRKYVLGRMEVEGFLTAASHAAALEDRPQLTDVAATRDDPDAAYFIEEARRYLFDELGGDAVLRQGLTIELTMDAGLQHAAVAALQQGLRDLDHRQGYRGSVRHVDQSEIPAERLRLEESNDLALEDAENGVAESPESAAERRLELARERLRDHDAQLLGVVTAVDDAAKSARVSFAPGVEGVVHLADVSWAREPNPKRSPYRVRSIGSVFHVGDVAHFSAVAAEEGDGDGESPAAEPAALVVTLRQEPIVQGALMSVDLATQELVAMVGGYDFATSQFNRVTQARRQPGSAFKPIIYAAALGHDYTPASIVVDRPVVYTDEASGFIWRPQNYKRSFYGPITLRDALARSVNNATVHLFRDIGINYVIQYARRLGIESPLVADLSLALGSSGVSLLEMTRAYAVFANGGRRVVPTFIRRVLDRDGNVLLENVPLGATPGQTLVADTGSAVTTDRIDVAAGADASREVDTNAEGDGDHEDADQVIPPEEAYLATSLLRAVVEDPKGTGWRVRELRRPMAGKTGTTNDQADAWFIGFSPQIATGVWVGHDETRFLGLGETGSRAAAPIWVDYMRAAVRGTPWRDFPIPKSIVFARIDRKSGLLADGDSSDTVFQAFLEGTVPSETAKTAKTASESRRQLRLDSF